jgi:hypothetical protein
VIVGAANPGWRMRWRIDPKMVPSAVSPTTDRSSSEHVLLVGLTGWQVQDSNPRRR